MFNLVAACAITATACFMLYIIRNDFSGAISRQLLLPVLLIDAIFVSALISPNTIKSLHWILFWVFVLSASTVGLLLRAVDFHNVHVKDFTSITSNLKSDSAIAVLLFILVLILRVWMLGTVLSGDHSEYYTYLAKACRQLDFSPASMLNFDLCAHASYSFGLFYSPGEFLFPGNVVAIQFLEMVSASCCAVCIYFTIKRVSVFESRLLPAIAGIAVLSAPINWIMSQGFAPDYGMVVFLIFMIHCDVAKKPILVFFWALLLGFTKEPAWILVIGYGLAKGVLLLCFQDASGLVDRFKVAFFDNGVLPFFLVCCIGLCYFLTSGIGWTAVSFYSGDAVSSASWAIEYNSFGFSWEFLSTRFIELYISNFTWFFSVVLALSSALLAARAKKARRISHLKLSVMQDRLSKEVCYNKRYLLIAIPCMAALSLFSIFMLFSISACSLRYIAPGSSMVILLAFMQVSQLNRSKRWIAHLASAGVVLLAIQAFYPLDMVTNYFFRPISIGKASVLCMTQPSNTEPGRDYYYCNLQCLWLDKALEAMLRDSNFNENDVVLIAGDSFISCEANGIRTEINGRLGQRGADGVRNRTKRWNEESYRLENNFGFEEGNINTMTTNALFGYAALSSEYSLSENSANNSAIISARNISGRAILYFSPLDNVNEREVIESLSPYFYFGERRIASAWGGQIAYYILVSKPVVLSSPGGAALPAPETHIEGIGTIEQTNERGTLRLYDPAQIYRVPSACENQIIESYYTSLSTFLTDSHPEDSRTIVREGDVVSCRIRIEKNGEWVRYSLEPSGYILTEINTGRPIYISDLNEMLIGRSVGDEIIITSDEISPWMNREQQGETYSYSIVITSISQSMPVLSDDLFESLGFSSREEYYQSIEQQINHSSICDEYLHAAYLISDYDPHPNLVSYFQLRADNMFEGKAAQLGMSKEDFISNCLGLSSEEYEQLCLEYGYYFACINDLNQFSKSRGLDLYWQNNYR